MRGVLSDTRVEKLIVVSKQCCVVLLGEKNKRYFKRVYLLFFEPWIHSPQYTCIFLVFFISPLPDAVALADSYWLPLHPFGCPLSPPTTPPPPPDPHHRFFSFHWGVGHSGLDFLAE